MWRANSLQKVLMLQKDWRQEKRVAEDEMIRQYHRLNGHNMSKLQEIVKDSEA